MEFDYYFKRGIKPDLDAAPPAGYVLARIPFCGFYESALNLFLENEVERESEYLSDEESTTLEDKYKECFVEQDKVGRMWLDAVTNICGLHDPIYLGMTHPAYYNFETDKLYAYVKYEDMLALVKESDSKILEETIKDATTSCSGYSAFYKAEQATWELDMPFPLWQLALEAYLQTCGFTYDSDWTIADIVFFNTPFNELVEWVEKPTSSAA